MLNAEQICASMELDGGDANRLSIVPRPDLAAMRSRAGTSIDLRLGRWFRSFKPSGSSEAKLWHAGVTATARDDAPEPEGVEAALESVGNGIRTNEHFIRFGSNFVLHPGRFVLGVTMEWLTLPRTLSGYVTGKSSLGRHGLVIETAAGLHPGFSGCLTLELANVGEVPVAISPGMEICQIFLHDIDDANGDHPGTFSGQRKPAIGLPKPDPVFDRLRGRNRD